MFLRHNILPLFALVLLILAVPVTVDLAGQAQDYFTRAAATPANIVVNYSVFQGDLPRPWEAFSQGGELEGDNRTIVPVEPALSKAKSLGTRYIRLDHILNRPLAERLATIRAIKSAGMTPFISLSYFSTSVADKDTGPVKNWSEWQRQVKELVAIVSKEIPDVYYEVWNEPDGKDFGNMSADQYVELYRRTVAAADSVTGIFTFKIGGPALANPDNKKWMQTFIARAADENLRLDFLSWHRYHPNPAIFISDLNNYDQYLSQYPKFSRLEKVVSEWGTDPQPSVLHNSFYDSAHFMAVTRQFLDRVSLGAKFELRDGFRNVSDKNGLGILTYNLGEKNLINMYRQLQNFSGNRVLIEGEGSYVTGFASVNNDKYNLVLVNFDPKSSYLENVPVRMVFGTEGAKLQIKKTTFNSTFPSGKVEDESLELPNGEFSFTQQMLTNTVIFWEMKRV